MRTPRTHREVIALWPSAAEFGRAIGVSGRNAQYMRAHGIPARHYEAVLDAIAGCGFPVRLTYHDLSSMKERDNG